MGLFFYRTSPLPSPPNINDLLVWMDSSDIASADGASVPSMNNKGTLGGTWSTNSPLAPLAATVGGRRALSFPYVWFSGGTNRYGYNLSSFTFPAITATQGITMVILANQLTYVPDGTSGPNINLASAGNTNGASGGLIIGAASYLMPFPLQYRWYTSQPSQNGSTSQSTYPYGMSAQITSEFVAYGTKLSTTIANNQEFFKIRQSVSTVSASADFVSTGIVGTLAGPVTIGGPPGGSANYEWGGWIREVLIWNTVVSSDDIKTYLNNKHGGTW
jgi:hypothetical protein